jgi:enamine deaminase RidA (YjgF/YER057c/UK114 family)
MKSWLPVAVALASLSGCAAPARDPGPETKGRVSYLNPDGLHKNPVYSQAVAASGRVRTVYVGGQNAVDAAGAVVGKGDVAAQAAKVASNLLVALAAAGARAEHIVKWNIHVVQGQPPAAAMKEFQRVIGPLPNPPTITVLYVSALASPDFLMEVDAVAVVPED